MTSIQSDFSPASKVPQEESPTVAVVISTMFATPADLSTTLDNLTEQTLEKGDYRIVICSDDQCPLALREFLDVLRDVPNYATLSISRSHLACNADPLAAKREAVKQAATRFALFLNAGDQLDPQFLKRAIVSLETCDTAGWLYPTRQESSPRNALHLPAPFSVGRMFFEPVLSPGAVYRSDRWLAATRSHPKEYEDVHVHDEWLAQMRLMAAGHVGLPGRDCVYYCNWPALAFARLTTKKALLSHYLTLRASLLRLPLVVRAKRAAERNHRKGWGYVSRLHPMWLADRMQSRLSAVMGYADAPASLGAKLLFLAALSPARFVRAFTHPESAITLAELRCEFFRKPNLDFPVDTAAAERRPTILFGHTNWTIGGAERVLQHWIRAARSVSGTKLIEVCERETNRVPEVGTEYSGLVWEVRKDFSRLCDEQYSLEAMGDTPLHRARVCWEVICRERPGVIFISGNAYLYALLPTIRKHFPKMVVIDILHNEWNNHRDWFNLSSEYAHYLDERITISEHWRDVLSDKYGERSDRIRVFPNAIDLERFTPSLQVRKAERERLGVPDDVKLIGFVGRVQSQKNPAVFFELARQMAEDRSWRFVIAGDGPEREALLREYAGLRNLEYLGPTNDVARVLNALDVIVFTSNFEGYPLTSLEAAAMGLPIIAPDIVGFREQVANGDIGLLYSPSGDRRTDADRIRSLLTERFEDLARIGAGARAFVEQHHDATASQREISAYLAEALFAPSLPPRPGSTRKRLFLHIGLPKTGSTSIQYFLYENRGRLKRCGILYPEEHLYGYAHHPLTWHLARGKRSLPEDVVDRYTSRDDLAAQLREFATALRQVPQPTIVLSSEGIVRANPELARELFYGFDVRILVFLRRQDHFLESAYNQDTKMHGLKVDVETHTYRNRRIMDYLGLLNAWSDAFGDDKLIVIPFEQKYFPEGLERKFVQLLGGKWQPSYRTARMNIRLSRDALEFLGTSDQLRERLEKSAYRRIVDLLEQYSLEHPDPPGRKGVMSPDQRRRILEQYRTGNEEVARRFLGGQSSLFSPPEPEKEEPAIVYSGLTEPTRLKIIDFLQSRGISPAVLDACAPSINASVQANRKTIHLHIGLHKTGSTSIQHFLARNREVLQRRGYVYPGPQALSAHHRIALHFFTPSKPKPFPQALLRQYGSVEAWREDFVRSHKASLNEPGDHLIYSSEAFSNCEPLEIRQFFDSNPVRIVVFLRRQDEWLESRWNQNRKSNHNQRNTGDDGIFHAKLMGDYWVRLQKWERHFGRESLVIVPFEQAQMKHGLEHAFLDTLGIELSEEFVVSPAVNTRLNRDCTEFLNRVRKNGARPGKIGYQSLLRLLEQHSREHPDPPEWRCHFPPLDRIALLERFRESNAEVARYYLGRADGRLFFAPEPSPDEPWAPYPGLSDQVHSEILEYLGTSGFDVSTLQRSS